MTDTARPEVAAFGRRVISAQEEVFPGPDGLKKAAYVLIGLAVRALIPFYGRSGAHQEVIDFVQRMKSKDAS